MATKPTRQQQQASDNLAEALYLVAEAFRLDGKGRLAHSDFALREQNHQCFFAVFARRNHR